MSELMTPEDCRYYANGLRQHGCPERAAEWERAAATIEALQAQLAERAPASVDTDEAREALDDLLQHTEGHLEGGYYDDDLFGKAAVEADRLCRPALDALDASRAECVVKEATILALFGDHTLPDGSVVPETEVEARLRKMADASRAECERLRAELAKKPAINCKPDDLPGSPCHEKLRAECERLRGLLREAEWSGYIEGGPISDGGEWYPDCCPWCGGHRVDIGHAAGCPCAAALGGGQ